MLKDIDAVFEVQTFYEQMFLKMGLPITYLAFRLDREGLGAGAPFAYPTDFDAAYWREAEAAPVVQPSAFERVLKGNPRKSIKGTSYGSD